MDFLFNKQTNVSIDNNNFNELKDIKNELGDKFFLGAIDDCLEQYAHQYGTKFVFKDLIPWDDFRILAISYIENSIDSIVSCLDQDNDFVGSIDININANEYIFRFEIEDNGTGIDPEVKDLIFKQQIDSKKNRRITFGGFGVATYTNKAEIDELDGKYGFNDKGKNGAMFWFEIPMDSLISKYGHK
jgi:hypothetical protein